MHPASIGTGAGPDLVSAALTAVPAGQLTVAAAAPGNAASVRALLAAGFVPLGSLQLFRRPAAGAGC
jgi:RimJ/RimL family protein N-acetyltransferase